MEFARYIQINRYVILFEGLKFEQKKKLNRLNLTSLVIGLISSFGMTIVGNFQVKKKEEEFLIFLIKRFKSVKTK